MYSGVPKARCARLHVHVRGEPAVDDRRPRPDDLGQDHPGERLGVLLRERARERHRRHRTRERERGDADDLVVGRELHDPLEHRGVEAQRGARVDDREDRRFGVERRGVDAPGDPDHLQAVDVALATQAVAVDRLVHQGQRVERRVQVPDAVMEVDRLDRIARQEMDRGQGLGETQQVLVVGPVADPPAAVEVGHVRRAADGPERDPVATEFDVVSRVAGMEGEPRRRRPDALGDHVGVEPDPLRARLDRGTGRPKHLAAIGVEEVHPDLGEHAQRTAVDGFELVRRDHLGGPVAHAGLSPRPLGRERASSVRLAASGATATESLARGGVHVRHTGLPIVAPRPDHPGVADDPLHASRSRRAAAVRGTTSRCCPAPGRGGSGQG